MTTALILLLSYNALVFLLTFAGLKTFGLGVVPDGFHSALTFTVIQALLSSVLSTAAGLAAAPGYACLRRMRKPVRWILLFPNIMSPVMVVLALLVSFSNFPYGLAGVLIGHIFLNAGLATVWLGEKYAELEERWAPVSRSMGAGPFMITFKVILPQLVPQIRNTAAVIFSLCLTSFAVPLVLGGGPQASTLEVLIYERIHVAADVPSALVLGLVQAALQLVVFIAVLRTTSVRSENSRDGETQAQSKIWILPLAAVCAVSLVPVVILIKTAIPHLSEAGSLFTSGAFRQAAVNSMTTALVVSILTLSLLAILSTWGWKPLIMSAPTLSGVAVGLTGVLLFKTLTLQSQAALLAALVWGHVSVIFLPVFRLSAPGLLSLRARFETPLKSMGAGRALSFERVYLPLAMKTCLAGAVLAGCWSAGEFSVAAMVAPGSGTLPTFIQGLMSSYRLEAASACSLILLLLSFMAMTALEGLTHGLG